MRILVKLKLRNCHYISLGMRQVFLCSTSPGPMFKAGTVPPEVSIAITVIFHCKVWVITGSAVLPMLETAPRRGSKQLSYWQVRLDINVVTLEMIYLCVGKQEWMHIFLIQFQRSNKVHFARYLSVGVSLCACVYHNFLNENHIVQWLTHTETFGHSEQTSLRKHYIDTNVHNRW